MSSTQNEKIVMDVYDRDDFNQAATYHIRQGAESITLRYEEPFARQPQQVIQNAVMADLLAIEENGKETEPRRALAHKARIWVSWGWGFGGIPKLPEPRPTAARTEGDKTPTKPEMTDNEDGMQIEVSNIDYGNRHQVAIRRGDDSIILSYGATRIALGNQTLEDAVIADLLKIHKDAEQPESRRALALRAGMRVAEGWGFGTMRQSVLQIPVEEPPTPVRVVSGHAAPSGRDDVTIVAADEPGPGGANHEYLIDLGNGATPIAIDFQKGGIEEAGGRNGLTHEMLLAIVIDRLESFQAGPFPSDHNEVALFSCRAALATLHKRTEERRRRGVEGALKA